MTEQALVDVQMRMAELEKTIDELSETVREQWQQLDRLTSLNTRLLDRVTQLEYRAPSGTSDEPPPPHY